MQFITDGPDIPDELLQSHEEGRLVFFCGAGVSYPAGLPGFEGLVNKVYKNLGTTPEKLEQQAIDDKKFDTALDLLERRFPGHRLAVRQALFDVLKPKLRKKGATSTQSALLTLSEDRTGAHRLVTTNFDRVFHAAARRTKRKFNEYTAPMLPIPKKSKWDGLVFLHGLLEKEPHEASLNRLVVTSGDFGLAYLTERWASRFVSELFKNYDVCFVGYSLNDPVLRYMMDALAADRMLGESVPRAWALGEYYDGEQHQKRIDWEAKGVIPILYKVPNGTYDHSALHNTLTKWADTYKSGVLGKEQIIVNHALSVPSASTNQDNFVGRVLWALSDDSGLPAKRFADFNPVPQLDWLFESFTDNHYGHDDLSRYGVIPNTYRDDDLTFSLVQRPTPYSLAPLMQLRRSYCPGPRWDSVMFQIARWLVRHLDDPKLLLWVSEGGISDRFKQIIESQLSEIMRLEHHQKTEEIEKLIANAPRAIPNQSMRKLWRLVLNGKVKSNREHINFFSWMERLQVEGLTILLRQELREILAPKVILSEPFRYEIGNPDNKQTLKISDIVDCELTLATNHVQSFVERRNNEAWSLALPEMVDEFQWLLRDALDLLGELELVDEKHDRSHWDLPSISPHRQNRGFRDWVCLIEFLRDAWLQVYQQDKRRAQEIALGWFDIPYPTFKRLAFFAASQDACIPPARLVEWLTKDSAWWLWASDTAREVYRVLVLQGAKLSDFFRNRLELVILEGPPRIMYRDDLKPEQWEFRKEREIWLHLAKLRESGAALGENTEQRFKDLSKKYPKWRLADNERDEFSHWMSGTGDPDFEVLRDVKTVPRKRKAIGKWLKGKDSEESGPFSENNWEEVCQERFFHSLFALYDLSKEDVWPIERWHEALHAWCNETLIERSAKFVSQFLLSMPDPIFIKLARTIATWLENQAKFDVKCDRFFTPLCERLLSLPIEYATGMTQNGSPEDDAVMEAINHPAGIVAQALINKWVKQKPNDGDTIAPSFCSIFTAICDGDNPMLRHARVVLSSRVIVLFRVDRTWTSQHLLPLFDWGRAIEAKAVWEGFLWSPRIYPPLLHAIKPYFLETAHHYESLGAHRKQYAVFLTFAALDMTDNFSQGEYQEAFAAFPASGLAECAQALVQAVEAAGEQKEEYWNNRIKPFWHHVWPKSVALVNSEISVSLARLAIASGKEFSNAVELLKDWFVPIQHSHYVLHMLHQSNLCETQPEASLIFLSLLIGEQDWIQIELSQFLVKIIKTEPRLENDKRYTRLLTLCRASGRS
jgi:hypothetical protein